MAEWDRELAVDPEAVRRAAGAPRSWRFLGAGWDCDAWLADESVVWRVPRRNVGITALQRESKVMPRLTARLPAAVPVPELVEAAGLPILARHALVPGTELAEAAAFGATLGAGLGRFLKALHDPAFTREAVAVLPVDPLGRADPAKRVLVTHQRLDAIASWIDVAPLRAIVEGSQGPALPTHVVCHGDLHLRHVLVDANGELSGVIDWGDSCIGAAPMDLAIVTALDAEGRRRFFEAYGAVDEASWKHARLLGVMFGASLLAADPVGTRGLAMRRWLERIAGDGADPRDRSDEGRPSPVDRERG